MRGLESKKVLVLGLAKSGVSACSLLLDSGAVVTGYDERADGTLRGIPPGIRLITGTEPGSVSVAGYDFAVTSPGIPPANPLIQALLKAGIPVISELELGLRALDAEIKIVTVTGTNGKTTTAEILAHLTGGRTAGNIGTPLSAVAGSIAPGELLILEVSSFQVPFSPSLSPHAGLLLNIFPEHIDWHGSMKEYTAAKMSMFRRMNSEKTGIFNAEIDGIEDLTVGLSCGKIFFSSLRALPRGVYLGGNSIVIDTGSVKKTVPMPGPDLLPGSHNLENYMAALAACPALGIAAVRDISGFRLPPHRMEHFSEGGIIFIDDSKATNLDSTCRALESTSGPLILLMGGRSKGQSHNGIAPLASRKTEMVIAFGESRGEVEKMLSGSGKLVSVPTLKEAVRAASESAADGWKVLLSPGGSSFDEFTDYTERGIRFRQWAKEFTGKNKKTSI